MGPADQDAVAVAFAKQVGWCEGLGAPFTATMLRILAEEAAPGGPLAALLRPWPGDPVADALALRLAGAFHALVLLGTAPELAACFPPAATDPVALRAALLAAAGRHESFIRDFLRSPPQTNEVGRSAVLLGGFLRVASRFGLPLRTLEIGASAGLNMLWDSFGYRIAGQGWGDPASPVQLAPDWRGPRPPLEAPVVVAERAGCDVSPFDLSDPAARLRLRSYVWADQSARLARVDGAIALAAARGVAVERADAASWVAARLADPAPGRATVLYHSIMWQYMPAATQEALRRTIAQAGAAATAEAPFAWLRFEPPDAKARPELRLTCWPGGAEAHLATAHPHGSEVLWHGAG